MAWQDDIAEKRKDSEDSAELQVLKAILVELKKLNKVEE